MGNEFLLLLLLMWCCQCHSLRTNLNQNNLFKKIMINRGFTSLRENVAKFSVAPMLDYTYSHQRFLQRLISKRCTLYTEMVTANALVNTKDVNKELRANLQVEEPVVLQLGGADPLVMNRAAQIAYNFGYRDININVGCPSSRVSEAGCFGAALMLDPARVAELALSIQDVLHHPPTVKCRIGVNNDYDYERLQNFIEIIATKGNVNHFIVHARFAILNAKLSAEQNRKIPPLKYDVVYSLVKDFPNLRFTINGGLNSTKDCLDHLSKGVHGVMVGRAVVKNPFLWRNVDSLFYQEADPGLSRREVLQRYAQYCREYETSDGPKCRNLLLKPIYDIFCGLDGSAMFRRDLDRQMRLKDNKLVGDVIETSMNLISSEILDER